MRSAGNSATPLYFLGISAVLNIALDLVFVPVLGFGIAGAAVATVISQFVSGIGILIFVMISCCELIPKRQNFKRNTRIMREIADLSFLTCAQQSAMNFGILLIQRLVDSFGPITMAAFAAAVKIDSFAYLPVQDFGNAFSTFAAQNYGAGKSERLRIGFRKAAAISTVFSLAVSAATVIFARPLMRIFVSAAEAEVLSSGITYLRIEGAFYFGIGLLFLLYGFYRAVKRPGMSFLLTVISLGTRVILAYALCVPLGEPGIWAAIPIGWILADTVGFAYYFLFRKKLIGQPPEKV